MSSQNNMCMGGLCVMHSSSWCVPSKHLHQISAVIKGWVFLSFVVPLFFPLYVSLSLNLLSILFSSSCCQCAQLQRASVSRTRQLRPITGVLIKCTCEDPNTHTFLSQMFARLASQTRQRKGEKNRKEKKKSSSLLLTLAWHTWLWFTESWGTKLKMSRLIYVPVHLSVSTTTCPPVL